MSYNCKVSKIFFSAFPTWSFLSFTLIFLLGALISFFSGASFVMKVNWVLDFSQSLFHSIRQRNYTQEVFRLVWPSNLTNYRLMPLELGNDPNQHWCFCEYNKFKPTFRFCLWPVDVRNPNWTTIESDNNEDWFHFDKTVPTPITRLSWRRTLIQ